MILPTGWRRSEDPYNVELWGNSCSSPKLVRYTKSRRFISSERICNRDHLMYTVDRTPILACWDASEELAAEVVEKAAVLIVDANCSVEHNIVLNGQIGFVRLPNNSVKAATVAHKLDLSVDKHFVKDDNIVASEVTPKLAKYRGDTPNAPKIIIGCFDAYLGKNLNNKQITLRRGLLCSL